MGWKSPFLADSLLSCWVKIFPFLGRKFLFFSQFPTPFLGGFFSFSGQAFGGNVGAEKITYRKTKNYLSSKNNPLPWDAKSDPRGEGLEVLGNEEGSCRSPIRGLFG